MFNTTINFVRVIRDNFPSMLQERVAMQWNRVFTKPVRDMYKEYKLLKAEYIFKVRFNGQACYLQDVLNIKFDPLLNRIHVVDTEEEHRYLRSNIVAPGENRIYMKYDETFAYSEGQFAIENGYLFVALAASTGSKPKESIAAGEANWAYHTRRRLVLRANKLGIGVRYIVYLPSDLEWNFFELRAIMNTYRMVGLSYTILNY